MRLRTRRVLPLLLVWLAVPRSAPAQVVAGNSLQGDWVRVVSNNNPNDQMRIQVNGDAILTSVPASASNAWKVGQVLWRQIQGSGSLQVRGSDGRYYAAQLSFNGPDEVHLAIQLQTAGDTQTWRRAGPTIDGDWVQVAPAGAPNDGMRIRVQTGRASVRYLPSTAPRAMRIGSRLWQNIGARGAIQVLGSDRQYHGATYTLLDANTLQVDATSIAGGPGQIWVRPAAAQSARATLAAGGTLAPPPNPNQPGAGLQPPANLPTVPTTPATPPIPPAAPRACLDTSLPHDRMGLGWRVGMYSPSNDPARAEVAGIRPYMVSGLQSAWTGNGVPSDIEYARFPGLQEGMVWISDGSGSRRVFRDQTGSQLDGRIQAARPAGERPADFEGHDGGAATVYSTVWESNTEGIDWTLDYDLTGAQYGSTFQTRRGAGYRLVDMEAYQTAAGLRYAAIWWASCDNGNWKQLRDMTRQAYQSRVSSESAQGFRVVDFESYPTASGQRYAAIWQRVPGGRDWAVRTDRSLDQFLNWHNRYVDEGMRLIDIEAYETPTGSIRYAGVWAENEARYDYAFRSIVDTAVANYRAARGVPGISVVVMQDDRVIYRRGFGWADSVRRKEAHAGTVYLTASISKVIGATIAARLEERGIIDLSARTRSILTNMPSGHTHTLEQLLAKTGCVGHYGDFRNRAEPDTTRVYRWQIDVAERLWKDPMLSGCTPGANYHYSTHGFSFVGAALEEVTGKPFGDILRDELTSPFNLPSMRLTVSGRWGGFPPPGVRPYELARGYDRHPTKWGWRVEANYENPTWKPLGGGMQTNALDLARFGWLTLDGQIVSPTTRDQRLWRAVQGGVTDWSDGSRAPTTGLAWVLDGRGPAIVDASGNSKNRFSAEHGGTARGAKSMLRIYRNDGLTIAIMSNQSADLRNRTGNHQPPGLATRIARIIFRNPPPP